MVTIVAMAFFFSLLFSVSYGFSCAGTFFVFWRVCLRRNSISIGTGYSAANGFTESVAQGPSLDPRVNA
jgi:hypothetical protein